MIVSNLSRSIVSALAFLLGSSVSANLAALAVSPAAAHVKLAAAGKSPPKGKRAGVKGPAAKSSSANNSSGGTAHATTATNYRLPDGAFPTAYKLNFEPDLVKYTFQGKEEIELTVTKPLNEITLNSAEIQIGAATLSRKAAASSKAKSKASSAASFGQAAVKPDAVTERVKLSWRRQIGPGDYVLKLAFKGILNDKLRGFYRSRFKDAEGKTATLATTQMEPADARRMFPCFDEPSYKATFQISCVIPSNMSAISNANIVSTSLDEKTGKLVVSFGETPRMSSYLVALVVGPFDSTQPVTSEGVQVRVWYLAGHANLGNYARDIAANLLPFYNQYFGVPYPMKKLDLVAIPDFEAGAMENLGCITFRESRLLVDTPTCSIHQRMDVTSVIAHEMAHMWFGDLVTMKWWDDLWLNEAFATWMSHKAVNNLHPEWKVWDEFNNSRQRAMETDSLSASRPIHFAVNNPLQANEMFDEITYSKGASILRMLETYVGEETFRTGVQEYISAHKFANATTSDLWSGISDAAKQDINELMKEWVSRPGYPMLTVEKPREGRLNFKQERFYLVAREKETGSQAHPWQVPIVARDLSSGARDSYVLKEHEGTMETGKIGNPFVVNTDGNGYFRSHYPPDILAQVSADKAKLSVGERFGLLCDQWALAYSGVQPIGQYLDYTSALIDETDANVIKQMIASFYKLYDLVDDKQLPLVSALVRERLQPIAKRLGWQCTELDTANTTLLREEVLEALGTIGQDQETIDKAKALFSAFLSDHASLNPNLVDAVTDIVAFNGGEKEYDQICALWKEARTPEDEKKNLMALGLFREAALTMKTLHMCITDEVRSQDAPGLMGRLLSSRINQAQAWSFIKSHWSDITARFALNTVPDLISSAESLKSEADERDLKAFLQAHPVPAGHAATNRTIERVQGNVQFLAHSKEGLDQWLTKHMSDKVK